MGAETLLVGVLYLLVKLLILGLVYYVVMYALTSFGAPPPIPKIVQLIFVVIAVIIVVGFLLGILGHGNILKLGLLDYASVRFG